MTAGPCPVYLTVRTANRDVLEHLVGLLSTVDGGVETISVADPCDDGTHPVVIDLGHLTRKQWEAIEVAKKRGRYDAERGGNLEEIAAELDISESAVSQRLRAAEAKIISSILGERPLRCNLV